jgi:hypothetical protein
MRRDNADFLDQLKATQEHLRATQAQLAEIVSFQSASSGRKIFRRTRVPALSQSARARTPVH